MIHFIPKTENTLKKIFILKIVVSLMLVGIFFVSTAKASEITADNVIELVNQAREKANIQVLTKNSSLERAAQDKAQDMFDNNYFAHISPAGKTPWFWIENQEYDYRFAGENLAINYTNAQDAQKAWMDSELHRKNILNADYQEIGVAVERGFIAGQKTIVAVQMFGAQFPKAAVASAVDMKSLPQVNATIAVENPASQKKSNSKIAAKMDMQRLYEDNKMAFIGWFAAAILAIFIAVVDVLAIFHKRHPQLFILHRVRNRHV